MKVTWVIERHIFEEEQEAAIIRQLELEKYHKELPLKLLELIAEADSLDLDYKVVKEESNLIVLLYKKGTNYRRYGADVTISLYGEPYEYYEAVNYISTIKEEMYDIVYGNSGYDPDYGFH